jgi:hypothetical protein
VPGRLAPVAEILLDDLENAAFTSSRFKATCSVLTFAA